MNTPTNSPRTGQYAHTPTPWRLQDAFREGDMLWTAMIRSGVPIVAQCKATTRETAETNAALIVRAVNSHAALVAALEAMLHADDCICENRGHKSDQAMQRIVAIDQARAALSAARNT